MRSIMNQTVGHMNDAAFKKSMTFIEYHVDKKGRAKYENVDIMMRRLGAGRSPYHDTSPYCTYKIGEPPYVVLNRIRGLQGCWNKHRFKSPDMNTA